MNNRILVVDDNPAIHGDFNKILRPPTPAGSALDDSALQLFNITPRARRHPVVELSFASSGEEALSLVKQARSRQEPFAMAFMDVQMPPGWDGVQTVQRLWEVEPDLQIVFCTAYSDYSWADLAERLGHSDKFLILKKPFEAIEVTQLAVAMLQKAEATRESQRRVSELDTLVAERTRHLHEQVMATRATEERFSKAFNFTPTPMVILKAGSMKVVDANESFARLAGQEEENAAEGRAKVSGLLAANPDFRRCVSAGGPLRGIECRLDCPAAGQRTLVVSREIFPLGGEPHLLVVAEDITDRLASEERLRQSQKMEAVGQLAAGIAHDFNNIMTVILGRISDHVSDPELPDCFRSSLTEVLTSGSRAAELTRQLLAFGRRQSLSIKPLDLDPTLRAQVCMLGRVISENYTLDLKLQPGLSAALADPSALHHIVMNLVINARDAMPNGGLIELRVSEEAVAAGRRERADGLVVAGGRYVCLSIRDEGCGMDERLRARIFEPFFTTKEVGKGSGLGLPMVYGLVAQLAGWVEVDSQPGHGSEFRVYLPAAGNAAPVTAPLLRRASAPPAGHGRTAMIVEDDAPIRRMLSEMVRRFGFKIVSASSGNEALTMWERDKLAGGVDLVITDVVMPGSMSGLSLGARLQAECPDLKIVYSTGYSAEMLQGAEFLMESNNYLPKPYDLTTLSTLLADLFPPDSPSVEERSCPQPGDLALASTVL